MLIGFMSLPAGGPTNDFYDSWSDFLQPMPTIFLKAAAIMGQWFADLAYDLGNAVLTAWNSAWKLADFSTLFINVNKNGTDMTGYNLAQYTALFFIIGLVIMSVMMAVQFLQFTLTSGRRGKEWPAGIVTIMVIIWMVPVLITSGNAIGRAANTQFLGNNSSGSQSVLTQIWRNNSVDLQKAANANFEVSGKNPNVFSPITNNSPASIVKSSIFTAVMDDEQLKKINSKQVKDVFTHKMGESSPEELDKGSFLTKSAAAEVYPRIKTNWFGIITAEVVFAIVGFLAVIELLVRFYRLAYYSATLLLFAFRDMEGKKAMQILHVMEGSIIGVALLPLNLLLFFGFIQWGMTTIGNLDLGWAPYTVLTIALLVAGAKGLLGGFALIDDWTGVPTGHGSTLMGMVGAASTASGIGRGIGNGVRTGASGVSKAASVGTSAASTIQSKVAKAGEKAANMRNAMMEKANESGILPNYPMPDPSGKSENGPQKGAASSNIATNGDKSENHNPVTPNNEQVDANQSSIDSAMPQNSDINDLNSLDQQGNTQFGADMSQPSSSAGLNVNQAARQARPATADSSRTQASPIDPNDAARRSQPGNMDNLNTASEKLGNRNNPSDVNGDSAIPGATLTVPLPPNRPSDTSRSSSSSNSRPGELAATSDNRMGGQTQTTSEVPRPSGIDLPTSSGRSQSRTEGYSTGDIAEQTGGQTVDVPPVSNQPQESRDLPNVGGIDLPAEAGITQNYNGGAPSFDVANTQPTIPVSDVALSGNQMTNNAPVSTLIQNSPNVPNNGASKTYSTGQTNGNSHSSARPAANPAPQQRATSNVTQQTPSPTTTRPAVQKNGSNNYSNKVNMSQDEQDYRELQELSRSMSHAPKSNSSAPKPGAHRQ